MTEVDLFVSTQRIKVLTADTQVSRNSSKHMALWPLQPFLFGLTISALLSHQQGLAQ